MSDILYDAAMEYKKLERTVYRIIVGRKGYSYPIMLHFPPESFFHLAGLQHLTDLTYPSTNKERIYKEISKKIADANGLDHMSAQAVGGAVGHNPISVIICCASCLTFSTEIFSPPGSTCLPTE